MEISPSSLDCGGGFCYYMTIAFMSNIAPTDYCNGGSHDLAAVMAD